MENIAKNDYTIKISPNNAALNSLGNYSPGTEFRDLVSLALGGKSIRDSAIRKEWDKKVIRKTFGLLRRTLILILDSTESILLIH